jgi:hypothetical protein
MLNTTATRKRRTGSLGSLGSLCIQSHFCHSGITTDSDHAVTKTTQLLHDEVTSCLSQPTQPLPHNRPRAGPASLQCSGALIDAAPPVRSRTIPGPSHSSYHQISMSSLSITATPSCFLLSRWRISLGLYSAVSVPVPL